MFSIRLRHESPGCSTIIEDLRIETQDGLVSYRATCTTSTAPHAGTAPDRMQPVARAVYEDYILSPLPRLFLPSGVVFVSTQTSPSGWRPRILFLRAGRLRAWLTALSWIRCLRPPVGCLFQDFTFPQDPYYLVFAAVDNAGNKQPLQEIDLRGRRDLSRHYVAGSVMCRCSPSSLGLIDENAVPVTQTPSAAVAVAPWSSVAVLSARPRKGDDGRSSKTRYKPISPGSMSIASPNPRSWRCGHPGRLRWHGSYSRTR